MEGKPPEGRHFRAWHALPAHTKLTISPEQVREVMAALGDDRFSDAQWRAIEQLRFTYTGACHAVNAVGVFIDDRVGVVGDPDNAAYEWVVVSADRVIQHSDCAYGSPEIALRDGLIAHLGLPANEPR